MSASLPIEVLQRYKGNFTKFFETGTSSGDSTQTAIEAGFQEIFTVEFDKETYKKAFSRFEINENIHVYNGESAGVLKTVLPFIEAPILFFLDAHTDCTHECTPLLKELEAIKGHTFPTLIMIDDTRLTGLFKWKEVTIPAIIEKLMAINPKFEIVFENNQHEKGDLLVAFDPAE